MRQIVDGRPACASRYESAEMFWRLRDCGVRAQHLVYCRESHADFATAWRPLPEALRQTGVWQCVVHAVFAL